MSEPLSLQMQRRVLALYRYTYALEHDDIEMVAAVMHEAEQDRVLEEMLLALNVVYQDDAAEAISPDETVRATSLLLNPLFVEETPHSPAYSNGKLPGTAGMFEPGHEPERRKIMRTQLDHPIPTQEELLPHTKRPSLRIGRSIQTLAAVLLVGILLSGFLVLMNARSHSAITADNGPTAQGMVIMSTGHGTLYGHRLSDGKLIWTTTLKNEKVLGDDVLVVQDHTAYYLHANHCSAVNATNGKLLWQITLERPDLINNSSSLTVDQGVVYVYIGGVVPPGDTAQYENDLQYQHHTLFAIRASNGTLLWKDPNKGRYASIVGAKDGVVYVNVNGGDGYKFDLQAINGKDGKVLWHHNNLSLNDLLFSDGVLYMTAGDASNIAKWDYKYLLALRVKDGSLLWSRKVLFEIAPLVVENGEVVTSTPESFAQPTNVHMTFCTYRTSDGVQTWCSTRIFPRIGGVAFRVNNGTLYLTSGYLNPQTKNFDGAQIDARDLKSNNLLWSKHFAPNFVPILMLNDTLYMSDGNTLSILSSKDGRVLWESQNSSSQNDQPYLIAVSN